MKNLIFLWGIVISMASCNNEMDEIVQHPDIKPQADSEVTHFTLMVSPAYIYENLGFFVTLESWLGISEAPYDISITLFINNSKYPDDIIISGKENYNKYNHIYEPLYIKKGEKFDKYGNYYGLTISDLIPIPPLDAGDWVSILYFTVELYDDDNKLIDSYTLISRNYEITYTKWFDGNLGWSLYLDGQKLYAK